MKKGINIELLHRVCNDPAPATAAHLGPNSTAATFLTLLRATVTVILTVLHFKITLQVRTKLKTEISYQLRRCFMHAF